MHRRPIKESLVDSKKRWRDKFKQECTDRMKLARQDKVNKMREEQVNKIYFLLLWTHGIKTCQLVDAKSA